MADRPLYQREFPGFPEIDVARPGTTDHASRAVIVESDDWEEVSAAIAGRRRFSPEHGAAVLASDTLHVIGWDDDEPA